MEILFRGTVIDADIKVSIHGNRYADFQHENKWYFISLDNPAITVLPVKTVTNKARLFTKKITLTIRYYMSRVTGRQHISVPKISRTDMYGQGTSLDIEIDYTEAPIGFYRSLSQGE